MSMNPNFWCTLFLLFSKTQPCNCTRVERHYQPRPFTKTDRDNNLYASHWQGLQILLYAENLYAIHHQLCHTALLRNIFCGQDPSVSLCQRVYKIVCCILYSLQTWDPKRLVVRPFRKPYTIKLAYQHRFFRQFRDSSIVHNFADYCLVSLMVFPGFA